MASSVPLVRQISWLAFFMQYVIVMSIIWIFHLSIPNGLIIGSIFCLIPMVSYRSYFLRHHRKGTKYIKQHQFEKGIPYFEKSVDFYTRNSWLDKYRYILLLTNSKMSIKELGLCSLAFCYGQLGNGKKAKEYYELILNEFPNNGIAITSLRFINSVKDI